MFRVVRNASASGTDGLVRKGVLTVAVNRPSATQTLRSVERLMTDTVPPCWSFRSSPESLRGPNEPALGAPGTARQARSSPSQGPSRAPSSTERDEPSGPSTPTTHEWLSCGSPARRAPRGQGPQDRRTSRRTGPRSGQGCPRRAPPPPGGRGTVWWTAHLLPTGQPSYIPVIWWLSSTIRAPPSARPGRAGNVR